MRFLVKVILPVEAGNAAVKAGKLGSTIGSILAELKPEAVYFSRLGVAVPDPDAFRAALERHQVHVD